MMRIVDHIFAHAATHPDKTAVVCGGVRTTYRQLADSIYLRSKNLDTPKIDALLNALDDAPKGVSADVQADIRADIRADVQVGTETEAPAQAVVFRASQSTDFIADYFAIHAAGRVAVPLEKDVPDETFQAVRRTVAHAVIPPDTADILFTTGTTGDSKGVMISHRAICANAENLIEAQGFTPELTFVIAGPLNHIGSLSKIYPVFYQGGTILIADSLKDINAFYASLDYPATKMATFLVPAAIRILLKFSGERLAAYADKIDFIETGAAPISADDMRQLAQTLPKSRLFNTYASTETGIVTTYNFNDGHHLAGCVGRPMRHARVAFDAHGHIVVSGPMTMTGYVGNAELTAEVLINNAVHTHDLGREDAEGRLHILGRDGDTINVGGFKVSPAEVEETAMRLPGVADCICIGVPHPVSGLALKLLVVLDPRAGLRNRDVALHLKANLEGYKVPQLYEAVDHVERTYNGKLNRKAYGATKPGA